MPDSTFPRRYRPHRPLVLCLAMVLGLSAADQQDAILGDPDPVPAGAGLLVELFTSEGCSSCPPAEALLNRLVGEAEAKDLPVIGLAWHVTYWNKLKTKEGVWADPYSADWATARQKVYATIAPRKPSLKGQLITPDLLFDGGRPGGGKDRQLSDYVAEVLAEAKPVQLVPSVTLDDRTVTVTVDSTGAAAKDIGMVALVQRSITQEITAGENHGRTLEHRNVVRDYRSDALEQGDDTDWQMSLTLPEGVAPDDCFVCIWVQHPETLAVRGLATTSLTP